VSYLVLARKYRPQSFEDLVGQDHVTRTLANAIGTGRIAHAFLFTGVRGVGKTTSARLLAKCLNCVGADGRSREPTATPCNVCSPCCEIALGQDLDVQEIDGASYNGVDEVRRLQEGISFRPARDRFKIYVVDEVHMLSTAAWNALLKTLEEPPAHVKFIFATTEAHKVPITILSRCQRYDFKLIPTQSIARRLGEVLALEGIEYETAAAQVLAREAAGSMRDAMSMLDQVIAFGGNKLTAADVARVLGVADRKILHDLTTALVEGDALGCIGVVQRVAEQGFDLTQVARDTLRQLRNLVVAKVSSTSSTAEAPSISELLDLADDETRDVVVLAKRAEADDLSRLFQGFSRAYDDIVRSGQPRMVLEMALVRLARRPPLLPLDDLLARVGDLERRLNAAPPAGPSPRGGGGGGKVGARAVPAGPPHASSGQAVVASPQPLDEIPARPRGALALAGLAPPSSVGVPSAAQSVDPVKRVVVPMRPAVSTPASLPKTADAADDWRAIVERLRIAHPASGALFEHGVPLEVCATRVVVGFAADAPFLAARATAPEALDALRAAALAHFGVPPAIVVDTSTKGPGGARSLAAIDAERRRAEDAQARAAVEAHPIVREAMRLFDAQLRDVRLPRGEG